MLGDEHRAVAGAGEHPGRGRALVQPHAERVGERTHRSAQVLLQQLPGMHRLVHGLGQRNARHRPVRMGMRADGDAGCGKGRHLVPGEIALAGGAHGAYEAGGHVGHRRDAVLAHDRRRNVQHAGKAIVHGDQHCAVRQVVLAAHEALDVVQRHRKTLLRQPLHLGLECGRVHAPGVAVGVTETVIGEHAHHRTAAEHAAKAGRARHHAGQHHGAASRFLDHPTQQRHAHRRTSWPARSVPSRRLRSTRARNNGLPSR